MRCSFSISLSIDTIPDARLIVFAICDGLVVIEQFFIDNLHVFLGQVGVDSRELRFGKNSSGCSSSFFDV